MFLGDNMKKFAVLLSLFAYTIALPLIAQPAQVIIIRHAEKQPDGNLSERGFERAGALAPYFALTSTLINNGVPVAVFAARPTPPTPPYHPDENTQRCIDTIAPTALFLRQPIHSGYAKLQEQEIANFILSNSLYSGKNVLICWHHDTIQTLAEAFGVSSAPEFPNVFDQTWVITYTPTPVLTIYQQQLLFGDTP
jgi:hypothetical protein